MKTRLICDNWCSKRYREAGLGEGHGDQTEDEHMTVGKVIQEAKKFRLARNSWRRANGKVVGGKSR
jgi:hypothetical protein